MISSNMTQRQVKAKSANVQKMLDNHARLDKLDEEVPNTIDGWVGFALNKDGSIMAGKNDNGIHLVATFDPVGLWAKEAERLRIEQEQHALLFSLTDDEGEEYRSLLKEANQ